MNQDSDLIAIPYIISFFVAIGALFLLFPRGGGS